MTPERTRIPAEEYARTLRERYGDDIERVILYGSAARGDDDKDSDIDILVITREGSAPLQRELSFLAFEVGLKHGVEISVQQYSESHFHRHSTFAFFRNVAEDGVAII